MVTAQEVKKLRDMTGAGMMDCKEALQEADGDLDEAVDILRKKGREISSSRAEREANEGLVLTRVSDDGLLATIVEVNCETDFVARNDEFRAYAEEVLESAHEQGIDDLDELGDRVMDSGETVDQVLNRLMGKIGEKLRLGGIDRLEATDGRLVSYVHPGSKLGVLVEVAGEGDLHEVGRDLAMQIAAMNPIGVDREDVPEEAIEREEAIAREQAENEDKPERIIDRIVEGKVDKFYEQRVLLEQDFVKDSSRTVEDMLEEKGVEVVRFIRYALGD